MSSAGAVSNLLSFLITREECNSILEKMLMEENKKALLLSYEIFPDESLVGYLGEYFHLYLKYRKENDQQLTEKRLFVKSMPYRNTDVCDIMLKAGILKKESTLYVRLLNELRKFCAKIWCSQCYLVKSDLFVMDNVEDLGYEQVQDLSKFLSKAQIETVLKSLAAMHSCSLAFEVKRKEKMPVLYDVVLQEMAVSPHVNWYMAGLKAIVEVALKHPQYQAEPLQLFIKNELLTIFAAVYSMVNPSTKYCNVFCHRDVWMGNIFFPKANSQHTNAVFVDFQLSRYSPPAIDVLMALHLNLRPTDRKLIEEECYKFYYNHFEQEMRERGLNAADFMTYESFLESLKEMSLFGHVYSCIAGTILRVPRNYLIDMKFQSQADFFRYTHLDRTGQVIALMKTNAAFSAYMSESVEDMMEYILNSFYNKFLVAE